MRIEKKSGKEQKKKTDVNRYRQLRVRVWLRENRWKMYVSHSMSVFIAESNEHDQGSSCPGRFRGSERARRVHTGEAHHKGDICLTTSDIFNFTNFTE